MKNFSVIFGGMLLAMAIPAAHATIQLSYSVDGVAAQVCATSPVSGSFISCAPFTDADANVRVTGLSGNSNSPGGPANANQFATTLQIENLSSTTTHTIEFWLSAQGFTFPGTPPVRYDASESLTATNGSGTVQAVHCIDVGNKLAPPTDAFCASLGSGSVSDDLLAFDFPSIKSANDSKTGSITSLPTPYSISQHITVVLNANAALNVNTSSTLTPVPEPISIALLGGVLVFTTGAIRRKRQQKA